MHEIQRLAGPQQMLELVTGPSRLVRPPWTLSTLISQCASSHVNTTPNAAKKMSCSLNSAGTEPPFDARACKHVAWIFSLPLSLRGTVGFLPPSM